MAFFWKTKPNCASLRNERIKFYIAPKCCQLTRDVEEMESALGCYCDSELFVHWHVSRANLDERAGKTYGENVNAKRAARTEGGTMAFSQECLKRNLVTNK
jgi:hypothetical protein